MKILRMLILVILIPVPSTIAGYRAYELKIENRETGKERTVVSTMDHLQYPAYYPVQQNEEVSYVKSWMCWENTGGMQEICPAPDREPAAESPKTSSR